MNMREQVEAINLVIENRYTEMRELQSKLHHSYLPKDDMTDEDWKWRKVVYQEVTELYDSIQNLKDFRHQLYQEN